MDAYPSHPHYSEGRTEATHGKGARIEGVRIIASLLASWIYENYINGVVILLNIILALNFLIMLTFTKFGSDFEYNSSQES